MYVRTCCYVNVYVLWSVFQQGLSEYIRSTDDLIIHLSKSHSYSKALYLHYATSVVRAFSLEKES